MSNVTSFGAATGETVLLSRALINAADRSCAVAGVVTCDDILLSRHHFTKKRKPQKQRMDEWMLESRKLSNGYFAHSLTYV